MRKEAWSRLPIFFVCSPPLFHGLLPNLVMRLIGRIRYGAPLQRSDFQARGRPASRFQNLV